MKARMMWALRVAVGLTILFLLARRVDLTALTLRLDGAAVAGIAAAVGFLLLAQALSAQRWRLLLGTTAPPWLYLWRLYAIGAFFSLFLPTSVGGDAVRATAAMRSLQSGGSVIASVMMDRALGMLALGAYALVGAFAMPEIAAVIARAWQWKTTLPGVLLLGSAVLAVGAAGWWLARRHARFGRMTDDALALLRDLLNAPSSLAGAVALAFVVQAAYILAWMAVARGLGLELPPLFFLFAVPVVSLASMLPVTFAGIGVREGAWVLLFSSLGLAAANAVAYSLLYFLCVIIVGVAGGAVFMLLGTGFPKSEVEAL